MILHIYINIWGQITKVNILIFLITSLRVQFYEDYKIKRINILSINFLLKVNILKIFFNKISKTPFN